MNASRLSKIMDLFYCLLRDGLKRIIHEIHFVKNKYLMLVILVKIYLKSDVLPLSRPQSQFCSRKARKCEL